MILNNLRKLIQSSICGNTLTESQIKNVAGDFLSNTYKVGIGEWNGEVIVNTYPGNNISGSANSSFACFSLTFGTGTTAPNKEDFQMESPLNTTSHFSWENLSGASSDNGLSVNAIIKNTTGADLSVSEIGLVMSTSGNSNSGTSANFDYGNVILVSRIVISPVKIPAGGVQTFIYNLDFSEL